jgi:uncharacterized protein (TIGR02597 family)
MRPFTSIAAALLVSLCALSSTFAQTSTVSTVPVGFNTGTIAAAASASAPTGNVASAPFYQIATFQGAVSSVDSSNQLSFAGASFGNLTATPFLAHVKTGNSTGRFWLISANTATQITLDISDTDSTPDIKGYPITTSAPTVGQTQMAVGDSVEIVPANTLGSLFGATGSGNFQTGGSAGQADNVLLYNQKNKTWDTYYNNGTHWRSANSLNPNVDNTVVLPDRGMFILRRAGTASTVTFLGTVPSTDEKTDLPGPGSAFIANRYPIDMTLGTGDTTNKAQLNFNVKVPNWKTGSSASQADNVLLWNPTNKTWDTYYHNGTHWRVSNSLNPNLDAQVVPLGSAMFVVRQSSTSGISPTFSQSLPYTL